MRRLQSLLIAAGLAIFLSPAHATDDLRLFAPVPLGPVILPASSSASPAETAPDMRSAQPEAGPTALLTGTDARWPASAAAMGKNSPEVGWKIVAQGTSSAATAAPRSIVTATTGPLASQTWQIAPQASTTTAAH